MRACSPTRSATDLARIFVAVLYAETPRDSDLERYREATGRRYWQMQPATGAWLVLGRGRG